MIARAREETYSVRSIQRALDILDLLHAASRSLSLRDIAAAVNLPKSSAFRYLATLEERGYVERDGADGRYRIALGFAPLHARYLDILARRARPYLEDLRDRLHETINLGVLDANRVSYLEIVESRSAMRVAANRRDRDPVHSTALGKAIAAQLTDDDVRRLLAVTGMPKFTSRTCDDVDAFLRELESVRASGHALDDEENLDGGRCVAVPVAALPIAAAISLSAPAVRLAPDRLEEVAATLREAAARLAAELERHAG